MDQNRLPLNVQSFTKLRTENYIYVDKTEYIWNVIHRYNACILNRPRRFGKSLLVSTLESYFKGEKDLFEGTAIAKLEKDWKVYPVIRFSFASGEYSALDGLRNILNSVLDTAIEEYHLDLQKDLSVVVKFRSILRALYKKTGNRVVVLVDEYDKPMLDNMFPNKELEEKNRELYRQFFSALKDQDDYIQFVFFTGVTKFNKISIFSDLNQLKDISMLEDINGICGITEDELLNNFQPEINNLARKLKLTVDECKRKLAQMYDGYRFSETGEGIYNPVSLFNSFNDGQLGMYWFETGTPTLLIRQLQKSNIAIEDFNDGIQVLRTYLMNYRSDQNDLIPLFYQSGYLTIKNYDSDLDIITLAFPNEEVKDGFLNVLLDYVLGDNDQVKGNSTMNFVIDLKLGKIESFMNKLQSLFAGIPYDRNSMKYEHEWRDQIYIIFSLLGQRVSCEVHSAKGRADCIVETESFVYIFEFKVDQSAELALKQIEEKKYSSPYRSGLKKIYKVGVQFSSVNHNIENWIAEKDN